MRDRALATVAEWFGRLAAAVAEAQAEGEMAPDESATQIAFEIHAYLLLANAQWVASGDAAALDRARHAIDRLLGWLAPSER